MLHLNRVVVFVALLVLSLPLAGVMAQDDAARTGLRPDAPAYGIRGEHAVGTRDLVIEAESPLDITVWYPALNDGNLEEAVTYPLMLKMDMMAGVTAEVIGQALSNAPPDLAGAPYPLVVLSPGFSMGRTAYAWLAEHLASYGFVVISPEHHERLGENFAGFWQATITRPQEVHTLLNYVDEQVEAGGTLEGLIDPKTVAVTGHSYGGYTTLAMAGARLNLHGMHDICSAAHDANDPAAWLCGLLLPYMPEMAELAGLDAVPQGQWESWGDERIDAIIPMAGDAYMFAPDGLAGITIPTLAIGGMADTGTPYKWGTQMTYEGISSEKKIQIGFENAEHMIFSATCDAIPTFVQIGFSQACSDTVWDMDRAHDLINHFATAFLLAELKGDSTAAAALTADAVAPFLGISYTSQGY